MRHSRNEIGKKMWLCKSNGEYIIKQGEENAMCFFIMKQGKAVVEIDGQERKSLERGDGFGDLALLYNAPRSASIRCVSECFLWAIERKNFKQVIEERIISEYDSNRQLLDNVKFFGRSFRKCLVMIATMMMLWETDAMTDEQKNAITGMLVSYLKPHFD